MSEPEKTNLWSVYKPFLVRYMVPQWYLIAGGIVAGILAAAAAGFGLPFMIQNVFPIVFGETEVPAIVRDFLAAHVEAADMPSVVLWGRL